MKIFDFFKKQEVKTEVKQINDNLFSCHYCQHQFEVNPAKDVFPTSVRALYKDFYFQAKGVNCPNCFNTCIYG